jgi:hypothetical protein
MEQPIGESIQQHFGGIPEPRLERTRLYELSFRYPEGIEEPFGSH